MTVKEIAKKVVDSLPDDATMDDLIHALYIQAKFQDGENEIREGKGVPHEQAKKRIREKRLVPPPFDAAAFHKAIEGFSLSDEAAEAIEEHIRFRHLPSNRER